jgi:hypothetical protein
VEKKEVIVPGVETPVVIETPVMETPSTVVSDVINERGVGLLGKLRNKGNKPRTGFLNKDVTKNKLGLFLGRGRGATNEGAGGETSEGERRGLIPSSIAERLRNKRNNQK